MSRWTLANVTAHSVFTGLASGTIVATVFAFVYVHAIASGNGVQSVPVAAYHSRRASVRSDGVDAMLEVS